MELFSLIPGKIKFNRSLRALSTTGFSLAEVLIVLGIGSALMLGLMSMFKNQSKGTIENEVIMARLELERAVIDALTNDNVCSFILTHASQAPSASPANRSADTFNASGLVSTAPAVININNLPLKPSETSPSVAKVGTAASVLTNKLTVESMKFKIMPNQPPDLFIADFEVQLKQVSSTRFMRNIVVKDIQIATDSTTPTTAKKIISCGPPGEALAQRITFLSDASWTVPVGIRRAFITMAGGGGSGVGWRLISNLGTGHSGGYVFSQAINLTPGEVLQVVVGKGGKGHRPFNSGVLADAGPPFYIYQNPAGDDGLGGHPGTSSKLISPLYGVIIECAGGSGVNVGGIDTFSGALVAGNVAGATTGSGTPSFPSPNRVAAGPYASAGAPGRCGPGPANYGMGNSGITKWGLQSGSKAGGITPFGYGSGGNVDVMGCHVNATTVGTCISPQDGRDGVVYIDIW